MKLPSIVPGLLLLAALPACTPRLTNYRNGWNGCRVGDGNAIVCSGKAVAQVECFKPSGEGCTALAIRYEDGQHVVLAGSVSFEPGQAPEIEADEEMALQPEISTDASTLWFSLSGGGQRAGWKVYEPQTGELRSVDRTSILLIRSRVQSWLPLWHTAAH